MCQRERGCGAHSQPLRQSLGQVRGVTSPGRRLLTLTTDNTSNGRREKGRRAGREVLGTASLHLAGCPPRRDSGSRPSAPTGRSHHTGVETQEVIANAPPAAAVRAVGACGEGASSSSASSFCLLRASHGDPSTPPDESQCPYFRDRSKHPSRDAATRPTVGQNENSNSDLSAESKGLLTLAA